MQPISYSPDASGLRVGVAGRGRTIHNLTDAFGLDEAGLTARR